MVASYISRAKWRKARESNSVRRGTPALFSRQLSAIAHAFLMVPVAGFQPASVRVKAEGSPLSYTGKLVDRSGLEPEHLALRGRGAAARTRDPWS